VEAVREQTDVQTDRQTYMVIAILCTSTGVEVKRGRELETVKHKSRPILYSLRVLIGRCFTLHVKHLHVHILRPPTDTVGQLHR